MYKRIGPRIKWFSKAMCFLGIIASIIAAISVGSNTKDGSSAFVLAIATLVGGCLMAWIGTWITYAIGDTNEKITWLVQQKGWKEDNEINDIMAEAAKSREKILRKKL